MMFTTNNWDRVNNEKTMNLNCFSPKTHFHYFIFLLDSGNEQQANCFADSLDLDLNSSSILGPIPRC